MSNQPKVNPLFDNLSNVNPAAPSSSYLPPHAIQTQPIGCDTGPSGHHPLRQEGYPPGAATPMTQQPPVGHPPPPSYAPVPAVNQQIVGHQPNPTGQNQQIPPSGWMSIPQNIPSNIPPGLEYLTQIDQLLVKQDVELLEVLTGFETCNRYQVKNSLGQNVYRAVEVSGCCTRNCCGNLRGFEMKIFDNMKNEVIHLNRPFACSSCCFPCCLQSIEVSAPPGNIVGYVEQNWSLCIPNFTIKSAAGDSVLKIKGPFCTQSCCCGDVVFEVLSKDGSTVVGKISKQWTGLVREAFTDADFFGITFPMDLDVRMKAVMLGACFLINMNPGKKAEMSNQSPPKYKVNPFFGNLCNGDRAAPSSGYPAQNVFRLQPVTQQPIGSSSSSCSGPRSSPIQGGGPGPSPGHPHAPGYRLLSTVDPQPEVHRQASNAAVSGWMNIPENVPFDTPPGLEHLTQIGQLLVKQEVETIEVSPGRETSRKYEVKNNLGQNVYRAVQVSRRWARAGLCRARSFELDVLDNLMNHVIYVKSPVKCDSCCFPCSMHVLSKDRSAVVGKICKQWTGLAQEFFTDADFFGITFPMDLDVRMKAVMLGACFLIDFMFFEDNEGDRLLDQIASRLTELH